MILYSHILSCNFSLLQFRPLTWRNTHPYMVVDRHEDITHPSKTSKDPTCDRSVTFYGYVRGTHLKPGMKMHLIGAGDYSMTELSVIPDPCPLPDREKKSQVRYYDIYCLKYCRPPFKFHHSLSITLFSVLTEI